MWIKPPALVGGIASTFLLLAACSGQDGSGDRPQVVGSSYPFAYVADQVGGDHVDVGNLTEAGGEPHDLELTPRQIAELSEATLVIFERGFQPGVDDAVEQAGLPDTAKLDVAEVVELDDEADPHVWLDPIAMRRIAAATADRLAELDPEHEAAYRRNLDRFAGELDALHRDFRTGLADCERRTIVTSHDAFGYLAERYGLEQISIAGVDPHAEPSPAEQAEIADLVRDDGITTVFTETLVSDDVAGSIADETGVTVATLDPIEGLSDDTTDETYLSLMRANLDAIRQANGCA